MKSLVNIKIMLKSLLLAPALMLSMGVLAPVVVHAQTTTTDTCSATGTTNPDITTGIGGGASCAKPSKATSQLFGKNSIFTTVTDILLFIIGAISVIMLIIGGIRYVLSGGDQGAVTSAKNTILYAIIGIIVAFLAYAAVVFVTGQLEKTTTTPAAGASIPSRLV